MSIKSARKLGFFAALTMLIGSVVGIGIFFKSHGVLRANDWDGTGTFLAWLLGGLLSLAAAVSFSEISSMQTNRVHGLPAWAEKVGGKKFGYFVRFNYSFFYFGLLLSVLGVFGSEMIFNIVASYTSHTMNDYPVYAHIILGLVFTVFFIFVNYFSVRASGMIATVSTVLKWVPLVLVALLGILFMNTNNIPHDGKAAAPLKGSGFLVGENAFTNGQPFKFTKMLSALPAVLFAFDAFLAVGNLRNKMEQPKKLPLVVLFGMISVLVLYLLIALAAIFHGSGMVSGMPFGYHPYGLGIFDQILDSKQAVVMGKFIVVFITISTFGVINGISAAAVASHEQAIETDTMFGAKTLKAKFGLKNTVLGYSLFVTVFWTLAFGVPAIILNSDSIVDGMSNFPTLFFFAMYATVILLYALKRDKMETKKMNNVLFKVFAYAAVAGIFFVVVYQLTWGFLGNAIMHPTDRTHWGLYVGDSSGTGLNWPSRYDQKGGIGVEMVLGQSAVVMFSLLAVFFAAPFVNMFLAKKLEKHNVVVDTQKA